MIDIYVGIDPSINSTGITCIAYDNNVKVDEKFYIIKPDKLTKRESEAEEKNIKIFEYILYNKLEAKDKENNHEVEYIKSLNALEVMNSIYYSINKFITKQVGRVGIYNLYICQEGISYGSVTRTKSVFDLAGLNYLLRDLVISNLHPTFFIIATPSEIKKTTSGNGNCKKEVMVELFKAIYPDFDLPKIDDVADSYWMQNYIKILKDKELI